MSRALRDRPKHQNFADWSDEDSDSPKPAKKASNQGKPALVGSIVQFARKGVSNVEFEKPKQLAGSNKRRTGRKATGSDSEDLISESDTSEPDQVHTRARRQGPQVTYRESVDASGEEEEASGSESEEGSDANSLEPQANRRATRGIKRPSPGGIKARPRRAAAVAPKNYKEPTADDEEEAGSESEQSDGDHEEQAQQAAAKKQRKAAAAKPKQQRDSKLRGGREGSSPSGPARRSSRHAERNVSYVEADMEDAVFEDSEQSANESGSESEGSAAQPSFDSDAENEAPRRATRGKGATAAAAKGKGRRAPAGGAAKKAKKRQTRVVSESEQSDSDSGQEESGSEGGSDEGSDVESSDAEKGLDYLPGKVEKIVESRPSADGKDEYRVKFEGRSYRDVRWVPYEVLAVERQQLVRNFDKRKADGGVDPYGDLDQGVHPDWLLVDRVIAKRSRVGQPQYLVKWKGLGYAEATWESSKSLENEQEHIRRFERFNQLPEDNDDGYEKHVPQDAVPQFQSGRQLRDYQQASLKWMADNCSKGINCILGDEMGLGKTAQSISVLAFQNQFWGSRGPFLVIAPLTTLGHWQREIETWTDMNCVVYAGGKRDREVIEEHDLYFAGKGGRRNRLVKPNVVLASFETVLKEDRVFKEITWETVIIDEAHRMKSTGSSTRSVIKAMDIQWLLLLTGTPVQNNMRELFGILNLLNNEQFADEEEFLGQYTDAGCGMRPDQVKELQEVLRPLLLRRMKEDVETLPEKEEVIIWVELTKEQRAYYKAIYEGQIATLMAGASTKNMPNLRNLAMELRKVCCHPYLCDGLEGDIQMRRAHSGHLTGDAELQLMVQACGKMVLLDKLLPKLKSEGHKVLIFSQFKIMLDVLDDYMKLCNYPCERIDGSTSGRDRQAAIDRFSKDGSDSFVFLLSTRAGGQGITLTAADTVIIYDSDWNPQNDLQAMARCHRIGQEKEVTIYRLVSRDTYEQHVFETSSRKYGLDEAILGSMGSEAGDPEQDSKKIADLLKHGAHCLHTMEGNEQTEAFAAEGIDQILNNRTEKRQIGSRAGNSFSVATFTVEQQQTGDDRSYWTELLPDAADAHAVALAAAKAPVMLAPRRRKKINYQEAGGRVGKCDSDSDYRADGQNSDDEAIQHQGKRRKSEVEDEGRKWSSHELRVFEERLIAIGPGRTEEVRQQAGLEQRTLEECREVEEALVSLIERAVTLVPKPEKQHRHDRPDAAAAGAGAADGGKENEVAPAVPTATEKSRAVPDVPLITTDTKLPRLVAKALSSKDAVSRLLKNAHKYNTALQEMRALAALVATTTPEQSFKAPTVALRGCGLPLWWHHPDDDAALLRGCHSLGWGVTKQQKHMEAILGDDRFGFTKKVRLQPVLPTPAVPADEFAVRVDSSLMTAAQPAAASAAPSAAPEAAAASVVPDTVPSAAPEGTGAQAAAEAAAPSSAAGPAAAGAAGGAQAQGAAAVAPLAAPVVMRSHGGPLPLDEKTWNKLVLALIAYLKKLLFAVVNPEEAAYKALKEAQRKPRVKPFRPTGVMPTAAGAGQHGSMEATTGLPLSRHDSNSLPKGPSPDKRPAGEQPPHAQPPSKLQKVHRLAPAGQQQQGDAPLDVQAALAAVAGAASAAKAGESEADPISECTDKGREGAAKPSGAVHRPAAAAAGGSAQGEQAGGRPVNPLSALGLQQAPAERAEGGNQEGAKQKAPVERRFTPAGAGSAKPKQRVMKQQSLFDLAKVHRNVNQQALAEEGIVVD